MTATKPLAITVLLFVTFVCLIGCVVTTQLFFRDCLWWECAPTRSFDVVDLGLPSHLFPTGAAFNRIHEDSDDNPETLNTGMQTIYWDQGAGLAIYIIDRYATDAKASVHFRRLQNSFFADRETRNPWGKPSELAYVSPIASEFYVACGHVSWGFRCGMVARYQEFVVFFNATMFQSKMGYQDFERVVIYIDEQMKSRLVER